jgi:putative transcriptional regulator
LELNRNRVGQYLVAAPALEQGFFHRSVVYIYEDSANGTAGLVVNCPTEYTLNQLLPHASTLSVPVYRGGPVNERSLLLWHSDDFTSSNTLHTGTGLDISSDDLMLQKLETHQPRRFRAVAGISVWAPGQLDFEIKKNYWLTSALPNNIVFEKPGDEVWQAAVDYSLNRIIDRYI